jgi:hypothetical protein
LESLGVARTLRFPSVLLQPLGHFSALESTTYNRSLMIIADAVPLVQETGIA